MTRTSFFSAGAQRSLLLAAMLACTAIAHAQPKAITTFGSAVSCTTTDNDHSLDCTATPSAPPGIAPVTDYYHTGFGAYTSDQMLYTSQYDADGTLLFSANVDGIYSVGGTQVYDFNNYSATVNMWCGGPDSMGFPLDNAGALSEICIIPKPGSCNAFYVLFWCNSNTTAYSPIVGHCYFRVVEVDIDKGTFPADASYSFPVDYPLTFPDCSAYYNLTWETQPPQVVANKANSDGSRDIYTVNTDGVTVGSTTTYSGSVRQWHISPTGDLPISYGGLPTPVSTAGTLLNPGLTKAKIFQIGGGPVLAYVGVPSSEVGTSGGANQLQTFDITTGAHNLYTIAAAGPGTGGPVIFGFEYLPLCSPSPTFCFSYNDPTTVPLTGGLGYAALSTSPASITPISGTLNYHTTDLELDFNGDLLMVDDPNPFVVDLDGYLAYLPASALASVSTLTAGTDVAICSTKVYVSNLEYATNSSSGNFYLGSYIRESCATTPSLVITTPTTTICASAYPTFTANMNGFCGTGYTWYKSAGTGLGFSFVAFTTSNSWTDGDASAGEQVYCTADMYSFTDLCSTGGTFTSNTLTLTMAKLRIADVDINTLCAPFTHLFDGYVDILEPQYTVTLDYDGTVVSGSGLTYTWTAQTDNTATLSSNSVLNPSVTAVGSPMTADFILTVHDALHSCYASRQVVTHFNTNLTYDLASRDSHYDMYDEMNTQETYNEPATGGNFWSSPDIVNRLHAGSSTFVSEPPVYAPSASNYLYVKIRNVGCLNYSPPTSGPVPNINLYWTVGGIGGSEEWPTNWSSSGVVSGCSLPSGDAILTAAPIPSIDAGSSIIYPPSGTSTAYTPPNPGAYAAAGCTDLAYLTPTHIDICYLSRIVDYHNLTTGGASGMTIAETPDPGPNTIQNNNIVSLNTGVIYLSSYPAVMPEHHFLTLGNLTTVSGNYNLQFVNSKTLDATTGASILNNYGYFKIYLGTLFDDWQTAGGAGTYAAIDYTDKSVTFDGTNTAELDGVPIAAGAQYMAHIAAYTVRGIDPSTMPPETINFREIKDDGSGTVCGNYSYLVTYSPPNPQGVLAVTELSQGPSESSGCEYAEMIVGNCGTDASRFVDVSGWIIDDNSGNFNTSGCSLTGITAGHYRLANNPVWQNVPAGSVIVAYNAASNCYALPTDFTVDATNNIYWIPVNAAASTGSTPVLERYDGSGSTSPAEYCNNDGATVYTAAYGWGDIISLAAQDAIQVRCPGCTTAYPGTPAFYHGLGYAPDQTSCFVPITAGANDLGGPVKFDNVPNRKYVFTGSTAADFGDSTKWTVSAADAAGSPPSSLGYVNSGLLTNATTYALGLPCCGAYSSGERKSAPHTNPATNPTHTAVNTVQGIRVFPNPASMTLNFEYPPSDEVTIKLLDIVGRLLDEQTIYNNNAATFNVKGYTPGLYMYQYITNGKTQSGKFLVE